MDWQEFRLPDLRYIGREDKAAVFASLRRQRLWGMPPWLQVVFGVVIGTSAVVAGVLVGAAVRALVRLPPVVGTIVGGVATGAIACLLALLGAKWTRVRLLAELRRRGLCCECGYDLRGTPDRCPECGAPVRR